MGCMSQLDEEGKCSCGYNKNTPTDPKCLPVRTILAEKYLLGRALSMNGQGISYIGYDYEAGEKVMICEFMPSTLAHRNEVSGVVLPFPGYEAQYKTMLSDYYDLGSSLKNMRAGENLLPIVDVFSEYSTVYVVYKYIKTISYNDYLMQNGGEFTWAQVKKLFMPLFTTISNFHAYGFIHRGISPETIRVNARGQLLLGGFELSALRTAQSGIEPELFPGYTAPEQYALSTWQGTWTDVYAVAAVLYKSLTGTMPSEALSRKDVDRLCPPEELNQNIPTNVAAAINHAMAMNVEKRTQTIDQFTAELLKSAEGNTEIYKSHIKVEDNPAFRVQVSDEELFPEELPEHGQTKRPQKQSTKQKDDSPKKRPVALIAWLLSMVILVTGVILFFKGFQNDILGNNANDPKTNIGDENNTVEAPTVVKTPNFVGRTRSSVETNPEYSNFVLTFVEEYNADYSKDLIFEQSVSAKAEVEPGMPITLKVSKGAETVSMPNLVGLSVESAEAMLKEMNIKYQLMPRYDPSYEYNVVASQTVEENAEVAVGGTRVSVYIIYGSYEQEVTTRIPVEDDEWHSRYDDEDEFEYRYAGDD